MRLFLLMPLAALLGGWTSASDILKTQVPPSARTKAAIVNAARDYWVDPYSIRDAQISSVLTLDAKKGLQAVCVKANAKNRMGAYAGRKPVSIRLLKGTPVSTNEGARGCSLPKLRYYAFPELGPVLK